MAMSTLQLYRNPYAYPDYGSISTYGSAKPCTPVGMGLKTGKIRVEGTMQDFLECNYLSINKDGRTIYGWITDVEWGQDRWYYVSYSVDAWRTYRSDITLGTQYIERSKTKTFKRDRMLGSSQAYPEVEVKHHLFDNSQNRVLVVQTRTSTGEQFSNTPVQPSPYSFYFCEYNVNNWAASTPINQFMMAITGGAEPENIVTMYSIPYVDISDLPPQNLPVYAKNNTHIPGWKMLNEEMTLQGKMHLYKDIDIGVNVDELMRTEHTVQLVVPEAGVMSIPDELLKEGSLQLRQDVDLFSGASNYMIEAGSKFFTHSVRGSSISSIPIVSDPEETYRSQNQNALATSLIGDVASIGMGAAMIYGSGGLGAAAGGSAVMSGLNGIVNREASIMDMSTKTSNPPGFLGTALVSNFNQSFWTVVTKVKVDNASDVHSNFGYPLEKVAPLTFPSSGYVKTQGCTVSSNGKVPLWAMEEINQMFNNGVYVN